MRLDRTDWMKDGMDDYDSRTHCWQRVGVGMGPFHYFSPGGSTSDPPALRAPLHCLIESQDHWTLPYLQERVGFGEWGLAMLALPSTPLSGLAGWVCSGFPPPRPRVGPWAWHPARGS